MVLCCLKQRYFSGEDLFITDSQGVIENHRVPSGNYSEEVIIGGTTYYFDLKINDDQKQLELVIEKPGALSGKVVYHQYELPVNEFAIKAVRNDIAHLNKSFTSETGEFYLDALPPGEYTFKFSAEIDGRTLHGSINSVIVEPDAVTENLRVFLSE